MKKAISLLLSALLILTATASFASTEDASPYPETLRIFCTLSEHISKVGADDLNDTYIFQEVERITGTHVEWIHPAAGSDVDAQINLMVASGDLPDIIVRQDWKNFSGGANVWADDGVIYDLTELIPEHMPYYNAYITQTPNAINDLSIGGRMYYVSEIQHGMPFSGPIYRADWLEKLGFNYPTTLDELYDVLNAFKTLDPNEDGKTDEWAMSGLKFTEGNFGPYFFLWPFGLTCDFMQIDGKVTYGPMLPEFADAMAYIHKLYEDGILDPDYATQDRNSLDGKFMNDMVGFEFGIQPSKMNNTLADTSDFRAVGGPNLRLSPDSPPYVFHSMYISALTPSCDTVITTACEDPGKALHWLDFFYGGEGNVLANFGIEGESFRYGEGGVPTRDFSGALAKYPDRAEADLTYLYRIGGTSAFPMRMSIDSYLEGLHANSAEGCTRWAQTADTSRMLPNVSLTPEERDQVNDKLVDIETYITAQYDKLINGQTPLEDIPTIQQKLIDMGIEACIDVYQAAYDRYLGK